MVDRTETFEKADIMKVYSDFNLEGGGIWTPDLAEYDLPSDLSKYQCSSVGFQ